MITRLSIAFEDLLGSSIATLVDGDVDDEDDDDDDDDDD